MNYPDSENKDADQLRGHGEAGLRLCFPICEKPVSSRPAHSMINMDNFPSFSIKTHVVGSLLNNLDEMILISTHNIVFYDEFTKRILLVMVR